MKRTKGQSQSNALFKWDNASQQITKYEEVMEMSGCMFKLCSLYIYQVKACTDTYNPIKKIPVHKQDHQRWRYIPVKTVITVKFSLNGEIQFMSWNSVEIVKFSHNCEFQLKLWRPPWWPCPSPCAPPSHLTCSPTCPSTTKGRRQKKRVFYG